MKQQYEKKYVAQDYFCGRLLFRCNRAREFKIEPLGERAAGHFPGQRVLASAGTEDEDVQTGAYG